MKAYTTRPPMDNPESLFTLTAYHLPVRKDLGEWVTRATAKVRPWIRKLPDRLHRVWGQNRQFASGAHCDERWDRERQLVADVERLTKTGYFMACMGHSGRLRASYEAVIAQVHRLLDSGDWWKPRQLVDTETGEVRETVYLPEDTWSAQTALHWCVQLLVQLLAAVPLGGVVPAIFRGLRFGRGRESISRTTEPATPHYKPGARAKPLRGGASALEDQDWLPNLARMGEKLFGRQPNLPATG